MRLKEDKSSWRASSVIHKDTRNAKDELHQKTERNKKDTKKWCKGKKGVKHKPVLAIRRWYTIEHKQMVCEVCNKILDYWIK